jgi:hypothetical protein
MYLLHYPKEKQLEGQMIKTGKMLNLLELVVWSGHIAGE